MTDYERVARVIRYLERHRLEQPGLEELAGKLGLSSFQLHRLFSRWAGVTPKDFLQSLTLEHAKQLLKAGNNVLESSLVSGLSGPGRLHDLCVTIEAATPGEIKSGGEGMVIRWGQAPSPFGECLIAESERGVCFLAFDSSEKDLRKEWPHATLRQAKIKNLAQTIFSSTPKQTTLRAFVKGSSFQVQVWRALLRIPAGKMTSYGRLANGIGKPNASRAVGSAVGSNAISWLIPCHRVIRETGVIGDYRWGSERKRAMLAWESKDYKLLLALLLDIKIQSDFLVASSFFCSNLFAY